MLFSIPENVYEIIETLEKNGHEAYIVGGCVRDMLLFRRPSDWDITTSALPFQTKESLKKWKTIDTGIKHGTVSCIINGERYEITTFRAETGYSDMRHPDSVVFIKSLEKDLSRRDFTINAIAYNPKRGIFDLFSGYDDINDRLIRTVGDPYVRFSEDALRILRTVRFSSELGFDIEKTTSEAMLSSAETLSSLARERVSSELMRTLRGKYVQRVLVSYPEVFISSIPAISVTQEDMIKGLKKAAFNLSKSGQADDEVLLYLFVSGICGDNFADCTRVLNSLRLKRSTFNTVKTLLLYRGKRLVPSESAVLRAVSEIGIKDFSCLLICREIEFGTSLLTGESSDDITVIKKIFGNALQNGSHFNISDLNISGDDLLAIGFSQGPQIGAAMRILLDKVTDGVLKNTKTSLLNAAALMIANTKTSKT